MTKNNHDHRASLMQRVNQLEEVFGVMADGITKMVAGNKEVDDSLFRHLDTVNRAIDSLQAQVNDLESRLAAHQMDTPLARLKRWWRRA